MFYTRVVKQALLSHLQGQLFSKWRVLLPQSSLIRKASQWIGDRPGLGIKRLSGHGVLRRPCVLPLPSSPMLVPARTLVRHSKKGKRKTVKAVAKRFIRTGSGKLKYWPKGYRHNNLHKSSGAKGRLKKPRYANNTQLKVLNKMLAL